MQAFSVLAVNFHALPMQIFEYQRHQPLVGDGHEPCPDRDVGASGRLRLTKSGNDRLGHPGHIDLHRLDLLPGNPGKLQHALDEIAHFGRIVDDPRQIALLLFGKPLLQAFSSRSGRSSLSREGAAGGRATRNR